jgi:hypothetical protein
MHVLDVQYLEHAFLMQIKEKIMIIRTDLIMAKAIERGAKLSSSKQFDLARKVLKTAGVCHFTIERVLYEPHNLRCSD